MNRKNIIIILLTLLTLSFGSLSVYLYLDEYVIKKEYFVVFNYYSNNESLIKKYNGEIIKTGTHEMYILRNKTKTKVENATIMITENDAELLGRGSEILKIEKYRELKPLKQNIAF